MAHKKAGGSSRNGRDSAGRRLGVKLFGGQTAIAGNIIIRQRGTKVHPGAGTGLGRDHTIYARIDGTVEFRGTKGNKQVVSIIPLVAANDDASPAKKASAPKATANKTGADDISLIGGIGPKINKALTDMGITTFAQIAAWSDADVEKIETAIKGKGRVAREDWIAQAKELAAGGKPRAKTDQARA